MLEWLLVGLPVAVTAVVFGFAVTTDPHDLVVRRISVPVSLEQRGYPSETVADLLHDHVAEILHGAGSTHREHRIEMGTDETRADQLANIVQVLQPIRATQRLLGMVDHVVDIDVVEHNDKTVWVHLRILAGDETGTLQSTSTIGADTPFEATLAALARELVSVAEPYAMAAYLYNRAISTSGRPDFDPAIGFLKRWLPHAADQHRPWAYNLLGMIAARSNASELAVAQYREALSWQPQFALAHVNWGRLLQESGALEGAVDHFRAALASAPDLAIAHVYLAEAQIAGGHLAQAQAQLQLDEARMLAPELARTYEIQAALFEDIGLGDLAARERQRATLARVRQPRQGYYDAM